MASFQRRWIVLAEQIFEIETVKLTMKNHSGKYVVGLQGYHLCCYCCCLLFVPIC